MEFFLLILSYLIHRFKKLTFCFVVQYHLSLFSRYCFCQVKSFGWPSSFTLFASCISVILPFQLKIKTSCATFTISSHDHALDSMKLVLWTLLWIGVLFSINLLLVIVIVIEILLLVLILGGHVKTNKASLWYKGLKIMLKSIEFIKSVSPNSPFLFVVSLTGQPKDWWSWFVYNVCRKHSEKRINITIFPTPKIQVCF